MTYSHSPNSCELPFSLKILEPLSFLLSHFHCTTHHLSLVYCVIHSFLQILLLWNAHSLYQTFAGAVRTIFHKSRALILYLNYPVVPCFRKIKGQLINSYQCHLSWNSLSIFIVYHSHYVPPRQCYRILLSLYNSSHIYLPFFVDWELPKYRVVY